jgi:hypothetical protein
VQRHRGCALLLSDPAGVEEGEVGVVDADPELDRHGNHGVLRGPDRSGDDPPEQPSLVGERRPASAPGDFGYRTAEVDVDVVGEVVLDDHSRGVVGGLRVDGVELQGSR